MGSRPIPFVFASSGSNECGMFDVLTGSCHECFRMVSGDSRDLKVYAEELVSLVDALTNGAEESR